MTHEESDTALACAKCGHKEKFQVTALVSVTVSGIDYTEILDEQGDREYGSDSSCICTNCGHWGKLWQFRRPA